MPIDQVKASLRIRVTARSTIWTVRNLWRDGAWLCGHGWASWLQGPRVWMTHLTDVNWFYGSQKLTLVQFRTRRPPCFGLLACPIKQHVSCYRPLTNWREFSIKLYLFMVLQDKHVAVWAWPGLTAQNILSNYSNKGANHCNLVLEVLSAVRCHRIANGVFPVSKMSIESRQFKDNFGFSACGQLNPELSGYPGVLVTAGLAVNDRNYICLCKHWFLKFRKKLEYLVSYSSF